MSSDQLLRFAVHDEAGERLDKFLAQRVDVSRTQVQRLVDEGNVLVNEHPAKASYKLEAGDHLTVRLTPPPPSTLLPEDIPLRVVYQDEDLLVIDKPAGLTVHPAPGHASGTLVNAVLALYPELHEAGSSLRPGLVHRLDKDTSGLMVVAKHRSAQEALTKEFAGRAVTKRYLALLEGRLTPPRGLIEAPIGRAAGRRQRMSVSARGRAARTGYSVLEYIDGCTLAELTLETGRTHQIRVHTAAIGHPVVGDSIYGSASTFCPRQFLHSHVLGFHHPSDGRYVEFRAELPPDLAGALSALRGASRIDAPGQSA